MHEDFPTSEHDGTEDLKAAGKGWKEWPLIDGCWHIGFLLCPVDMFPVQTRYLACKVSLTPNIIALEVRITEQLYRPDVER